ncbi:MAG: hypothetical protein MUF84_09770 [Anaerolineae bacterium]|nr:hypothetical protein [Anaerolineae bacterium]
MSSGYRHTLPLRILSVVVACGLVLPQGMVVAVPVGNPAETQVAITTPPTPKEASPDQTVITVTVPVG